MWIIHEICHWNIHIHVPLHNSLSGFEFILSLLKSFSYYPILKRNTEVVMNMTCLCLLTMSWCLLSVHTEVPRADKHGRECFSP